MLPQVILFLVILIYTLMHTYLYQCMVTFDLPISKLVKNAFLMTIAKFPMNIILALVVVALTMGLMWVTGVLWLITVPFI